MAQVMNQITDKPDWQHKVRSSHENTMHLHHYFAFPLQGFDEEITQKWKAEASQKYADLTPEMADYCIEELKYTTELYAKMGFLRVYNGDVVKSDVAIPTDMQASLKTAIAPLENVPAHKQDWHSGSGDKVLDLVHPSLFPLIYGLSRVPSNETTGLEDCISRCGQGEVIPKPPENQAFVDTHLSTFDVYSTKFQWLPCDVDISTPK